MRVSLLWLCVLVIVPSMAWGQSHPKSVLDVALKRVELAKRKAGIEQLTALAESLGAFEALVEKFPTAHAEKARALLESGRIKRRLGDFSGAESAWRRASVITSETRCATDALIELASMLRRQHKVPEAQAALEVVVKDFASEPRNHAEALLRLASLHRAEKRPDAAETALRKCLAEHPDIRVVALEALEALVVLKLDQSQPMEAAKVFKAVSQDLRSRFRDGRDAERTSLALDRIGVRLKIIPSVEPRP